MILKYNDRSMAKKQIDKAFRIMYLLLNFILSLPRPNIQIEIQWKTSSVATVHIVVSITSVLLCLIQIWVVTCSSDATGRACAWHLLRSHPSHLSAR